MNLQPMELLLSHSAQAIRLLLEFLSLISVAIGLVAVLSGARKLRLRQIPPHLLQRGPVTMARVTFGSWVALALEFQLGADVVLTTISREPNALIQLAAVALIRTFLNFFLALELRQEDRHGGG
ncbi:MAG: DUF1622 domain-containing protein [Vulcanococcus sp.]|uniref:DUF1622 domain-containing protein n=1 Tax=Vulcanococcus sp. TaxID=2856995 RepID=UPI0025DA61F8|nr:DUF1622 domain-containing protein [Vulcanococcus sp.]MBW0166694.1 DUF1622 domain-containing protein [Vulcanococcus sp.]